MGRSSTPNRDWIQKTGGYFAKMKYFELEVSDVRADFGGISEVGKAPLTIQDRRNDQANSTGGSIWKLEDAASRYRARSVIMFPME